MGEPVWIAWSAGPDDQTSHASPITPVRYSTGYEAGMALILAGIDEAGYGPLLGPMCVGMSVFRVEDAPSDTRQANALDPPCLWERLAPQISRSPRGPASKGQARKLASKFATPPVAIGDSKKLKLANSAVRLHPLTHLERGVLAMLRSCSVGAHECASIPADDAALLARLGTVLSGHECYGGEPIALPLEGTAGQLSIAGNLASSTLARGGVGVVAMRCTAIDERQFNTIATREGSKAAVTAHALGGFLGELWHGHVGKGDDVLLVCDRLGGRASYGELLAGLMRQIEPGGVVRVVSQSERRSEYVIEGARGSAQVTFEVESEEANLPVALASMIAKLVRELAMMRFNRYWAERFARARGSTVELKPTAGYRNDGWRWLKDASDVIGSDDRRALVREF